MTENPQTETLRSPKVEEVYARLNNVIDPELGISIVKLGLIYTVDVEPKENDAEHSTIRIAMTLTTPGCPLAAVFDQMLKDSLYGLSWLASDQDVAISLTFDPPWVPEMMDEEARAELGF